MKKAVVAAIVAAFVAQLATPAFAGGPLKDTTMQGWQRETGPVAMAYFRAPLHATKVSARMPRAGFMITQPRSYTAGAMPSLTAAPGMLDLGVTGRDFNTPWTATLNVSNSVAWASDPKQLPKNTHYMFDSGVSWVVVGLVSVGIIAGVYAMSDED